MKTGFLAFMSVTSVMLIPHLACASPTKDYLEALSKEGLFPSEVKSHARSLGLNMSHVPDSTINNTAKSLCEDLKAYGTDKREIEATAGETLLGIQQSLFWKKPTEQEVKKAFLLTKFFMVRSTEIYCPVYTNAIKKAFL